MFCSCLISAISALSAFQIFLLLPFSAIFAKV